MIRNLFSSKKAQNDTETSTIAQTETTEASASKTRDKHTPTPKRNVAQAQKLRPLVPADRKASARKARKRMRERENAEYEAMRTGDVAHMPKSEQLPWRVYIRDYVDARFNLGEFFIPVAVVVLALLMTLVPRWPVAYIPLIVILYGYLIASIIDVAIMWRKLKKELIRRYGLVSVARSSRSSTYAWSRAIQLRRWRLPKPAHKKRGNWPK